MKKVYISLMTVLVLLFAAMASVSAAEYVYYENDFSDPATLSDFTQLRGEWGVVDGQLMLTGLGDVEMSSFAMLMFSKDPAIMNLTDYILEVDLLNVQTQSGVMLRCDSTKASGETDNTFYGYIAVISNDATKGAIGRGNLAGKYEGNLLVGQSVTYPGANLRLKIVAEGANLTYTVTDKDTGSELWVGTVENKEWAMGAFGFRALLMNNSLGMTNLGMLAYDNLKVTAIGDVGDHLAAGKPLSAYTPKVTSDAVLPKVTDPLDIQVPAVVEVEASKLDAEKTEYVFYENDFSNPATIADFTQYRGDWAIKDGKLYYTARTAGFEETTNFAFILYSGNHDVHLLSDYTVEMDICNSQSACGLITHADLTQACSDNGNTFYGYVGYISNDGTKGATGYTNVAGSWGGNLDVSEPILTPGTDYHLKAEHKQGVYTFTISTMDGTEVWNTTAADIDWQTGSFGVRMIAARDVFVNLNNVGIDNMKVTVHGEQAVLLNAGYHPNAKIVGEIAIATEAPAETTAAPAETTEAVDGTADPASTVAVPAETTAAESDSEVPVSTAEVTDNTTASAETKATSAEGDDNGDGNNSGPSKGTLIAIVGVVAVVVVTAVVVVILKKKKK